MTDIPDLVIELMLDVPDHMRQARVNNTEPPSGIHTCQSGRAAGAEWLTAGDHWFCPFCGEQGPGYATEAAS